MHYEFAEYSNSQIQATIDEWIHGKVNRDMMKLKLIDRMTIEQIAEIYSLSPITVQRKIAKMKTVIKRHLVDEKLS